MSNVLNNAITGIAPDFTVDYLLALLSKGNLSTPLNGSVDLTTANQVTFNWDDNSTDGNANTTDKSMVLAYNPSKKESIYILDGAQRIATTQILALPTSYTGDTIELFMAFVSENGKVVSNSIYLGSGTVA
jgi:hypothetical protein